MFEDGDLFSENARRERQFRWKNIDAIDFGNDNGIHGDDNDVDVDDYIDDDESEEQWRRSRYEKEMFLKKVTFFICLKWRDLLKFFKFNFAV